ncbi:double-strand-break repair protein rad21-like protein 1 isoform X2 [Phycodurus eques]|uniref:double-strand-break repair protein rad21-like protein 1 isoform X2 n=1 Tax=Phycodurus eques TaxID=693459 RepID=UPI002ACD2CFB|nr:double-strand-break repair protein rad21-like protein 1 isoform X2 [Phycodurus eques]
MLNCWTPLSNKWETLNKIWLSVHWKHKVTKAHVIDCNLDTAIEDIISSPQIIGLRISGSLLLGAAQIFSRKAKYLLTDCSHALDKLKLSFRPDAPEEKNDLSYEGLESTLKEMPLSEDFFFLPHSSDFNMPIECFSQHQSLPQEITMNEYSDMSQCHKVGHLDISLEILGQPQDSFGDEGAGLDRCLDFLINSSTHPDFTNISPVGIPNEMPENSSINNQDDVNRRDPTEEECLNQSSHEQPTFVLLPVPDTSSGNKRRRKRKLIVDQMTSLSDKVMRKQLSDDSDLLAAIMMAPPTRQLMCWKENGTAVKLLARPCSNVIPSEIEEAFPKDVIRVTYEDVAVMQQDDREAHSNMSPLSIESLKDSSTEHKLTDVLYSSDNQSDLEIALVSPTISVVAHHTHLSYILCVCQDEHILDRSYPELPSEDSMFVHPSHKEEHSQSLLGSQNFGELQTINKRAHRLLKFLQCCSDTSFCLGALCSGHTCLQMARAFQCLLFLQKERAVSLHQSEPYQDIFFTAGPEFFTLEKKKPNGV